MSEHLYTFINPVNENHINQAIRVLKNDGVIAYPTEFNWAFGCRAHSKTAIEKIRKLKPFHPKSQPFSFLCKDITMVSTYGDVSSVLYKILKKVWPGSYTIILKSNNTISKIIADKRKTIGVRVPDSELLLSLIDAYGEPLATTSVPDEDMHFGYQVEEKYGHMLDLILDLGEETGNQESTIIDCTTDDFQLIRKGVGDESLFSL